MSVPLQLAVAPPRRRFIRFEELQLTPAQVWVKR